MVNVNIQFLPSNSKNGRHLSCLGFLYLGNKSHNDNVYWKCLTLFCKSTLCSSDDEINKVGPDHNYDAVGAEIEKLGIRAGNAHRKAWRSRRCHSSTKHLKNATWVLNRRVTQHRWKFVNVYFGERNFTRISWKNKTPSTFPWVHEKHCMQNSHKNYNEGFILQKTIYTNLSKALSYFVKL